MKNTETQLLAERSRDDRQTLGIELGITVRRWRARMDESLAPLGLSQAKWVPLRYLAHAGGSLPQRKLADQVGIEGPSLVRILDELERLGFIERQTNNSDRRAKTIRLTDQARPLITELEQKAEDLRRAILDGISDKDISVFCEVLARISHNLEGLES